MSTIYRHHLKMDMSLIQGTISGLKTAGDIAKGLMDLKTAAEVRSKVIELQSVILSAQSSAMDANAKQSVLVDTIRDFKEEIARMKAWGHQKQRYKLITPWDGTLVYSLKESMKESEPPHWICTNCYESGVRSILQERKNLKIGRPEYFCRCGSIFHAHHRGTYKIDYAIE